MAVEAASDHDESDFSDDGELSFSRWRSISSSASASPRGPQTQPSVEEESTAEFSVYVAKDTVQRIDSGNHNRLSNSLGSLNDRRGVSLSIFPNQLPPRQIAKKFGDGAMAVFEAQPPLESEGWREVTILPDEEFERDFEFSSAFPDRELSLRKGAPNKDLWRKEHLDGSTSACDQAGSDSSELSLQDLVEQQDQDYITLTPMWITMLKTLLFILIWFIFSVGLTIYNKELLGAKKWDFPAPLLMNTAHFTLQALISSVVLRFFCPSMRPTVQMSWKDYFGRVVPTAVATALDIDLTNLSLVFITISVVTMCKSSAPVFLLLFAFTFKLEAPSLKLFGIIIIISIGVLLTGVGHLLDTKNEERRFQAVGFILVILAAFMSGFRWTVTQILFQKKEFGLKNPLAVMSYLAPVMAVITVTISLVSEPWHKLTEHPFFDTFRNGVRSTLLLLLGGLLAFFMVLAEYLLISRTSAVTLTVAGVVKEGVTILVGVIFFADKFTQLDAFGLGVILVGVCVYNWFKYEKLKESAVKRLETAPVQYIPLTSKLQNDEEMHSF